MNKKFKKVVAGVLAFACVSGAMFYVTNLKSNAKEEVVSEQEQKDTTEEAKAMYETILNEIRESKQGINVEETITNKEDLKKELEATDDKDKVFSKAKDEVILELMVEQSQEGLNNMSNDIEDIMNVMKDGKVGNSGVNLECFENGNYVAKKTVTNDYGITLETTIKDAAATVSRAWHKSASWTSNVFSVDFGDRYYSYSFTSESRLFGKKIKVGSIGFRFHYNVSSKGLKAVKIADDGTKAIIPGFKLSIKSKEINDSVATHAKSNIDATVIVKLDALPGISIGGTTLPSFSAKNYKFNIWITLHSIGKKTCKISASYTSYSDDVSFLAF